MNEIDALKQVLISNKFAFHTDDSPQRDTKIALIDRVFIPLGYSRYNARNIQAEFDRVTRYNVAMGIRAHAGMLAPTYLVPAPNTYDMRQIEKELQQSLSMIARHCRKDNPLPTARARLQSRIFIVCRDTKTTDFIRDNWQRHLTTFGHLSNITIFCWVIDIQAQHMYLPYEDGGGYFAKAIAKALFDDEIAWTRNKD